jgi:hypothetical protein
VLAEAGDAIDHAGVSDYDDPAMRAARTNARAARLFLDHPALTRVTRERVRPRTLKRVRGSKSAERYRPAMSLLERAAEPIQAEALLPYCDRRTRLQHEVLLAVIEELERRGMRIPPLRAEAGALLSGPVTYIHPRRLGARDRLHGILVGDVLIDVPERARETNRERAMSALAARSHGRVTVLVLGAGEASAAVDVAVRDARERVAQPATV